MGLYKEIAKLVEYGIRTGLVTEEDRRYMINQLLEVFREDEYEEQEISGLSLIHI